MGFVDDIVAQGYGGYRGWPDAAAQADYNATGGSGKWTGGSTTGSGSSSTGGFNADEIKKIIAQFNPASIQYLPYEDAALKELAPYYKKILDQEGGDVEKAKMRMEEDYKRGVRYNEEDLTRGNVQRAEDLSSFQKYDESQFPAEQNQLKESLNARGILDSGIATNDMSRLTLSQEKRKEAVTRALKRQEEEQTIGGNRAKETAALTKSRGVEDLSTSYDRFKTQSEQEKRTQAVALGSERYNRAVSLKQLEQTQALQPLIYGNA